MTRAGWFFIAGAAALGVIIDIFAYASHVWGVIGPALTEERVRNWLGALSGWVAAIVAGATMLPLYRQLRHVRRQTDFQLGDALPTIDVTPDLDDSRIMVVRVVNWNRRGMLVHRIASNLTTNVGLHETKLDGEVVALGQFRWPMPLRGWEDRSKSPHTLQLKIFAGPDDDILRDWPPRAKVILKVQLLADTHTLKELSASVHP
ncbi:hypothetical protein [Rhizobium herbae]|uniref:Uncharacterized protein n=1 Tax=Rhizobium herbae TaxID=508661 RepID=A0ABS4EW44_9HYPH|nr:hypothetical protein [Rhizobium herbae]MBP1862164.1 hypothetical protein [Rhizobium herbae]